MATHKRRAATKAANQVALRPVARVERVSLFEREVREKISRAALDLVLSRAEVISEGQRQSRGGQQAYFGSTMLTVDLQMLVPVVRDACDAATARRLAALMLTDPAVTAHVKTVAAAEAARLAGTPLKAVSTEIKVNARGARVFVDVDVEAKL